MDAADLRRAAVAVLGLDTTTGIPPLITEVAVIYLDGGVISAGPFAYWVAPDAPMHQIRHQSWPQARLAPAWPQVAEQVQLALSDRVLVTHDTSRLDLLRRHLPDWQPPAGFAHTRDLAEHAWPGLANYTLGPATARASITNVPRVGPSAVAEAHAVALLLAALTRHAASTRAGSPRGRRSALWDAVQAAEDHAIADFLPPPVAHWHRSAGRLEPATGPAREGPPAATGGARAGGPVVAPAVPVQAGPLATALLATIRQAARRG